MRSGKIIHVVSCHAEGEVGDVIVGGVAALPGATLWEQSRFIARDGTLRDPACPAGLACMAAPVPAGFLATALLVAMARRGGLSGAAATAIFGGRAVICVPAERIGIVRPIFDPCFDRKTGAVLAQRHRLTGRFDGPSFEPTSVRIAF